MKNLFHLRIRIRIVSFRIRIIQFVPFVRVLHALIIYIRACFVYLCVTIVCLIFLLYLQKTILVAYNIWKLNISAFTIQACIIRNILRFRNICILARVFTQYCFKIMEIRAIRNFNSTDADDVP